MAKSSTTLSKSRLVSALQCPKRLYLEVFKRELAEVSAQTEATFETGHQVGGIAQQLYGTEASVEIPFNPKMDEMVRETQALLDAGARYPIFEATFEHEGVLVRVDVLMPDNDGWRIVEVKSSSSVKDYHLVDCGIQWWVLRGNDVQVNGVALTHVDKQFEYSGDGDYAGLLAEVDVAEEAAPFMSIAGAYVKAAKEVLDGDVPDVPVGAHCFKPFDCPFLHYCWPTDAKYPVTGLGGGKQQLAEYVAAGYRDIRDVPFEELRTETQRRIHRVTTSGDTEVLVGARAALEQLPYPRFTWTLRRSCQRFRSGPVPILMIVLPCSGPVTLTTVVAMARWHRCATKSF